MKIKEKIAKQILKRKLKKMNNEALYLTMLGLEKLYHVGGRQLSLSLLEKREKAIKDLKEKGFLCKFSECEEKAMENGYCKDHGG